MSVKIKELREKRGALAEKAGKILTKAADENRDLTGEEQKEFDDIHADIKKMKTQIDNEERQAELDSEMRANQPLPGREDVRPAGEKRTEENRDLEKAAFRNWAIGGMANLTSEQREYMQGRQTELTPEQRALSAGTTTAGGFTVPESFNQQIINAMKEFSGMRQSRAFILNTESGNNYPIPTNDDTGNVGAIVSENAQVTEQDLTFGQLVLGAYMYTSKIVRVSLQLMQDSAFDMESYLAGKLGERIGRAQNAHFTTGTGTGQPNGVVTASTQGKVGTTGQTTSVIYNDLVDLKHSVNRSYRGNAEWMLNDLTVAAITKLVDANGKPLWAAGIQEGAPDTILNHPYIENDDMPVMAANAKSILFGDFSNYWIRDVLGIQIMALRERYADFLQVGFLAFSRSDGDLVDAGQAPIKHYANSAT